MCQAVADERMRQKLIDRWHIYRKNGNWRNYDRVEVDFLCETRRGFVAVEIKVGVRWERRYNRGLERMRTEFGADRVRCYGVYRGARRARWNDIEILPVMDFLRHLWGGDILD